MRIELTLLRRANHRGENLLAGGAVQRSVATADFSSDHGGPHACSARQLVASIHVGSKRNVKRAGHSTARCAANRRTSATGPGRSS